jgi:hypothetical protein
MSDDEDFLPASEHFKLLEAQLTGAQLDLFRQTRNGRSEMAYPGRTFVAYRMRDRQPEVLDKLMVNDFSCDEEAGASTELVSLITGKPLVVNHGPVQVFDLPVFLALPLSLKLTWRVKPSNPDKGSLGFPIYVRTMSRASHRQTGVVHFETGVEFGQEFPEVAAA